MKNTIDFDVNQIQKIYFRASYHDQRYEWRLGSTKPIIKKFLWMEKTIGYETKPTGFYDTVWNTYISEDSLSLYNLRVKDVGVENMTESHKEVWSKPSVEVLLGYKSTISKKFDSDQEAMDWIASVKEMSNKTFVTI